MQQFTSLSNLEKRELILRASAELKISPILVEKDFWVSWLLNKIFQHEISKDITFKGGTSLSKCYGMISRFSEDIDLTIDRRIFNQVADEDALSNKGLQRLLELNEKSASDFVSLTFKPILEKIISTDIGEIGWKLSHDEKEAKNLRFYYPSSIELIQNTYVKQSVLIELGVRGEINPFETKKVTSYLEKQFDKMLVVNESEIRTLSPIRTFWEKITLLHAEFNRPQHKASADRLSRHYYDVHQLIINGVADLAIENIPLLYDVINHKKKYFRAAWAQYEDAIPGTLKIVPHAALQEILNKDYKEMDYMLFGEIPEFLTIIKSLQDFEDSVNRLKDA